MSLDATASKRLLIASLAGNLFLVGLSAGVGMMAWRLATERPQPRANLYLASRALPTAEKDRMRQIMRAHAVEARPDMEAAGAARHEASALMKAPTYNAPAIADALGKAREADKNARAKMDEGLVAYLGGLDQPHRAVLVDAMAADARARAPGGPQHHDDGRHDHYDHDHDHHDGGPGNSLAPG